MLGRRDCSWSRLALRDGESNADRCYATRRDRGPDRTWGLRRMRHRGRRSRATDPNAVGRTQRHHPDRAPVEVGSNPASPSRPRSRRGRVNPASPSRPRSPHGPAPRHPPGSHPRPGWTHQHPRARHVEPHADTRGESRDAGHVGAPGANDTRAGIEVCTDTFSGRSLNRRAVDPIQPFNDHVRDRDAHRHAEPVAHARRRGTDLGNRPALVALARAAGHRRRRRRLVGQTAPFGTT